MNAGTVDDVIPSLVGLPFFGMPRHGDKRRSYIERIEGLGYFNA